MGSLATFMQQQFEEHCPPGWLCSREVSPLSKTLSQKMGYKPQADILLERKDGSRRLWIELEISRADPVANHAKFATAHLFYPYPTEDAFISMISAHVARGRRNLAAHSIHLMRHVGMGAFQTLLLPDLGGEQIKRMNAFSIENLAKEAIPIGEEIERALAVSDVVVHSGEHRIYYVGDWQDVWGNVERWNTEIENERLRKLWGRRTITYFVFDPRTHQFAPSKFCAYLRVPDHPQNHIPAAKRRVESEPDILSGTGMTIPFYAALDTNESRFDGAVAHSHLTKRLAMKVHQVEELPIVNRYFKEWLKRCTASINVHSQGAQILMPPHHWNV